MIVNNYFSNHKISVCLIFSALFWNRKFESSWKSTTIIFHTSKNYLLTQLDSVKSSCCIDWVESTQTITFNILEWSSEYNMTCVDSTCVKLKTAIPLNWIKVFWSQIPEIRPCYTTQHRAPMLSTDASMPCQTHWAQASGAPTGPNGNRVSYPLYTLLTRVDKRNNLFK